MTCNPGSRTGTVADPFRAGCAPPQGDRAIVLRFACLCAGLAGLGALLHGLGIRAMLDDASHPLRDLVVLHSLLPRAIVALAAGAALSLAGMLLQRVLRNPLADASTLGVTAGAHLAIVAALAFAPDLGGLSREAVAFAGALAAAALVLGLTARQAFEPTGVVVAGMLVGLVCASASAALVLYGGQYLTSLFLWGAARWRSRTGDRRRPWGSGWPWPGCSPPCSYAPSPCSPSTMPAPAASACPSPGSGPPCCCWPSSWRDRWWRRSASSASSASPPRTSRGCSACARPAPSSSSHPSSAG